MGVQGYKLVGKSDIEFDTASAIDESTPSVRSSKYFASDKADGYSNPRHTAPVTEKDG